MNPRRRTTRLLLPSRLLAVYARRILLAVDRRAERARLRLLVGVRDAPPPERVIVRPLLRERAAPLLKRRRRVERAHPTLARPRVGVRHGPGHPAPLAARLGLAPDRRERVEGRGRGGRRRERRFGRFLRLDLLRLDLFLRRRRPRRRIRRQSRRDARVPPFLRLPRSLPVAVQLVRLAFLFPLLDVARSDALRLRLREQNLALRRRRRVHAAVDLVVAELLRQAAPREPRVAVLGAAPLVPLAERACHHRGDAAPLPAVRGVAADPRLARRGDAVRRRVHRRRRVVRPRRVQHPRGGGHAGREQGLRRRASRSHDLFI